MADNVILNFRCSPEERAIVNDRARELRRSTGDYLLWLVERDLSGEVPHRDPRQVGAAKGSVAREGRTNFLAGKGAPIEERVAGLEAQWADALLHDDPWARVPAELEALRTQFAELKAEVDHLRREAE
jgi:hypothetical protein